MYDENIEAAISRDVSALKTERQADKRLDAVRELLDVERNLDEARIRLDEIEEARNRARDEVEKTSAYRARILNDLATMLGFNDAVAQKAPSEGRW